MKYEHLLRYLKGRPEEDVELSFAEIEDILGFKLPASAYRHQPGWSNSGRGHSHALAWLEAGRKTHSVRLSERKVSFRMAEMQAGSGRSAMPGVRDAGVEMMGSLEGQADKQTMKAALPEGLSLYGALKGTVKVASGADLTDPVLDPPETESLHG